MHVIEGTSAPCDLSVVIPVRDEEANIPPLVQRITATIQGMGLSHEIIFVTDINRDRTVEVLREAHAADPRVKTLRLSIGRGHHVAVVAGLDVAQGRCVVIMDGDLQDHPEDIPKLYARLAQGFDIVYGVKERKNESWFRNLLSKAFVRIMDFLSDYKIEHNTSMFRIMTRRTVDELRRFREYEQSLTGLVALIGFPSDRVLVNSGARAAGETKYPLWRQINFSITFLLSFSTRPLRYISYLGVIISLLSFVHFVWVFVAWLNGAPVQGWTTLTGLVTLLGGIQLISLGVIGEYMARIFIESKRRPLYTLEERIGEFGAVEVIRPAYEHHAPARHLGS